MHLILSKIEMCSVGRIGLGSYVREAVCCLIGYARAATLAASEPTKLVIDGKSRLANELSTSRPGAAKLMRPAEPRKREFVAELEFSIYWSYGTLKSCEREKSGTSTVGRCGTQGGPPGRMIQAQ